MARAHTLLAHAMMTCNDFTFKTDKACCDFGYQPIFPEKEALEKTIEWYKKHSER